MRRIFFYSSVCAAMFVKKSKVHIVYLKELANARILLYVSRSVFGCRMSVSRQWCPCNIFCSIWPIFLEFKQNYPRHRTKVVIDMDDSTSIRFRTTGPTCWKLCFLFLCVEYLFFRQFWTKTPYVPCTLWNSF